MIRIDGSNTLDGINNNTYEKFFIEEIPEDRLAKNDREFIMAAIQHFTKLSDYDIDYVISHTNIFSRKEKGFEVRKNKEKYEFYLLDQFLKDCKDELRSDERYGKCTEYSICMAYGNPEVSKVMIGYIDNSADKLLHAVLLDCSTDEEYVYDYTMNLVMEKKQYLELMDYVIINEVDGENIKNDMPIVSAFKHIGTKFYLCFRDEIMRDLEKNKKVLKLED